MTTKTGNLVTTITNDVASMIINDVAAMIINDVALMITNGASATISGRVDETTIMHNLSTTRYFASLFSAVDDIPRRAFVAAEQKP